MTGAAAVLRGRTVAWPASVIPSRQNACLRVLEAVALGALLWAAHPCLPRAAMPPTWTGWSAHRASFLEASTRSVFWLRAPTEGAVLIPGGTFDMGSTPEELLAAAANCALEPFGERCSVEMFSNELPRRRVFLGAYKMDRTEVTVEEYTRCVRLGACSPPRWLGARGRFDRPSLPISDVAWADARDYCQFVGARLPTEAEWENAARGAEGRRYPWGMLYNSGAANHGRFGAIPTDPSDGFGELAPVGALPSGRTPAGILDLAGNVSEWVADRYAPSYRGLDTDRPTGPPKGRRRVVRGGDYMSAAPWLRGAARQGLPPATRLPRIGFRCAQSLGGT